MTKIKARDLRKLSKDELNKKLLELKKDLIKVNAQRSTGTAIENPGRIKQVRKTIARILTIINETPVKTDSVKTKKPVTVESKTEDLTKKSKPKKEAKNKQ